MQTPAVFPVLALIGGIAVGVAAPESRRPAMLVLLAAMGVAALAWRLRRERTFAVVALAGFCSAGSVLGAIDSHRARHQPLRQFFDDYEGQPGGGAWPLVVEGVLRADAVPTEYGASVTVDVERVRTPCGWMPAAGGARLAVSGVLAANALHGWRAGRRVRAPAALRLPTAYRNPGVADESFALARRGIALVGSVKSAALLEITARGTLLSESAAAVRAYARRTIRAAMPDRPVAGAIVTAILIGDRGGLDPALQRRLQEAGTYHVIAISGGNIAILAGLSFLLLRVLHVPARAGSLALAAGLCAYGYVAGGGPSVARATLAAAIYLLARATDHRSPALNVLAAVALFAVVYEPLEVFDPGLWLSYGATGAILVGADRVMRSRRERRGSRERGGAAAQRSGEADTQGAAATPIPAQPPLPSAVARSWRISAAPRLRAFTLSASSALAGVFFGTLCAELALFPVSAAVFHRITLAGLLLNFAAIPLMTVAQVAGLAVLAVAPLSSSLTALAGLCAAWGATGLTESARLLDVAPWLTWRVPSPAPWLVCVYYASCAGWLVSGRTRLRHLAVGASALAAAAIATPLVPQLQRPFWIAPSRELRVTVLDVGQGDASLVQFPTGQSLLVDAAGLPGSSFDLGERVIAPALLALGARRLDYLAITHGDPDHVSGAPAVARDFRPREIWEGVPVPPHPTLRELRAIMATGGATRLVRPDDRIHLGEAEIRVLHPPEPDWERQRVRNDDSIVLELRYGDVSIVLPGDIGAAVEETLAARLPSASLRVLKAAHHGSATSTSAAWLAATRPAAVVFSCGRGNRYGHPHPTVLDRVKAHGAQVFRTDEDGAVTVTTDGKEIRVSTFTGRVARLTTTATKFTKVTKEGHYEE